MLGIDKIKFVGKFTLNVVRAGVIIAAMDVTNAVTTVGKNGIFDAYFRSQTQPANWYIGLINGDGSFASTSVTDTMGSHTGWAEFTGYTESVRQTWVTIAAANGQITNTTAATFNINATGNVRGIFIASSSTKSETASLLWSTGLFASNLPVVSGDQIKITYTVAA